MVRNTGGGESSSIAHMRNHKLCLRGKKKKEKQRSWGRARLHFVSSGSWELVCVRKQGSVEVPGRLRDTRTGLPVEDGGEELPDQPLVIWLELLGIDGLVGFGVQVVRVEGPDGDQRLLICLVAQMAVRALSMPPIEKEGHTGMT